MQKININLQIAVEDNDAIPSLEDMQTWAKAAFDHVGFVKDCSFSARFVTNDEIQTLNREYRQMDKPTNILSFPYEEPEELADLPPEVLAELNASNHGDEEAEADDNVDCADTDSTYLGDLVISMAVLKKEALEQQKTLTEHAAHLIIHGCLHLLGYDHISDEEAQEMEGIEIKVLEKLGYSNPYDADQE